MAKRNEVLFDTNFLLTCVKEKVDCFEQLELEGINSFLVPNKVFDELTKLAKKNQTARVALEILNKKTPIIVDLGTAYADKAIIQYAKKHPDIKIATLDAEIRSKIRNIKVGIKKSEKRIVFS